MDREQIFAHVREQYGVEPDYPWEDDNAVLRHRSNGKWFGVVMAVGRGKLRLPGEGAVDVLNVKCDPILIGSLRAQEGYHPAYHMNKERWITVRLDGSVPESEIIDLIGISYALTEPKGRKRQK